MYGLGADAQVSTAVCCVSITTRNCVYSFKPFISSGTLMKGTKVAMNACIIFSGPLKLHYAIPAQSGKMKKMVSSAKSLGGETWPLRTAALIDHVRVGESQISLSTSVSDLGLVIDANLDMTKSCYCQLKSLGRLGPFLTHWKDSKHHCKGSDHFLTRQF